MKARLKKKTEFQLIFEPDTKVDLKVGKYYEIKPYKRSRSLEQNALMWKIFSLIKQETGVEEWTTYLTLLESAGVVVQWLETVPEAESTLKRIYRIVELKENRINSKGVKTCLFKCYVGSSKFTTNEMKILLDNTINLAYELGINVENIERG